MRRKGEARYTGMIEYGEEGMEWEGRGHRVGENAKRRRGEREVERGKI